MGLGGDGRCHVVYTIDRGEILDGEMHASEIGRLLLIADLTAWALKIDSV